MTQIPDDLITCADVQVVAVDCEMVGVGPDGTRSQLARWAACQGSGLRPAAGIL